MMHEILNTLVQSFTQAPFWMGLLAGSAAGVLCVSSKVVNR